MVAKNCNPVELRTLLRISILVPFFAFFNALLNDVLIPFLEKREITLSNLKSRLVVAVSWPLFLFLIFDLGLKDCD